MRKKERFPPHLPLCEHGFNTVEEGKLQRHAEGGRNLTRFAVGEPPLRKRRGFGREPFTARVCYEYYSPESRSFVIASPRGLPCTHIFGIFSGYRERTISGLSLPAGPSPAIEDSAASPSGRG